MSVDEVSAYAPSDVKKPKAHLPSMFGEEESRLAFETLIREYEALKAESTARIGFRDQLLYVNLGAVGAVFSFATTAANAPYRDALLVIPWLSFILGWTYVVNDRMVSRLGEYVREELWTQMITLFPFMATSIETPNKEDPGKTKKALLIDPFRWEPFHRADETRIPRKRMQFVVDVVTFTGPALVALGLFCYMQPSLSAINGLERLMIGVSLALHVMLLGWIWLYADIYKSFLQPLVNRGKRPPL